MCASCYLMQVAMLFEDPILKSKLADMEDSLFTGTTKPVMRLYGDVVGFARAWKSFLDP